MSSPNQRQSWTRNRATSQGLRIYQLCGRERARWCAIVVWVILFPYSSLWSAVPQTPLPTDPLTDAEHVLRFADTLFQEGDYFRAITEYKRFIFLAPTDPRAGQVQLQIGRAYLRGQQWEDARRVFQTLAQEHPAADVRMEAAFLVGETAYQQGAYTQAIEDLRPLAERESQSSSTQKARYRLGWSYLRARQWTAAADAFARIDPADPLFPSSRTLSDAARQAQELPHKSPALAGALSVVLPGAGHFYTGRMRDGALALLLNGGFLVAGLEAVAAGNDAAAGLLFFFEAAWYAGSIYGAVNAAHKYNRDQEDRWIQGLELQHSPLSRSLSSLPRSLVLVHIPF